VTLRGDQELAAIGEQVLRASRADQTEVVVSAGETALTRFANSVIHQNVHEVDVEVRVRAVVGHRVGVAIGNRIDGRALAELSERAREAAVHAPEDPSFPGLPGPARYAEVNAHAAATATCSPERRARDVKAACSLAVERGIVASGLWSTRERELLVANSLGVRAYRNGTQASFKTVMMTDSSSGYAERTAIDFGEVDTEAAAREAADLADRSRDPQPLDPGEYPVVLQPYAVGTMIDYLAYMGLGALDFQEGRSWVNDVLGERVAPESISLWDDGLDPAGTPMAFDFEGVPKQRVPLIDRGVVAGVVYDRYTAAREQRASTGHALPAPNPMGPFPLHLFMAAGEADDGALLQGIERGVWVTRFHYVNPVHPKKTVLTGMTRDGTFLIENGQITRPLRNFRFTQSVLEALAAVEAVGNRRLLVQDDMGGTCVPALRIGRFRFSSATAF
jgi:predicted Zn-dependent protease